MGTRGPNFGDHHFHMTPDMYEAERKIKAKACAVTALDRPEMTDADVIDDCAVPKYAELIAIERLEYSLPCH